MNAVMTEQVRESAAENVSADKPAIENSCAENSLTENETSVKATTQAFVPNEQSANEQSDGESFAPIAEPARDLTHAKLILEAALLSSSEPLQLVDLKKLFDQELSADVIRKLLDELRTDWAGRAVELTPVASGWRFRVKPEFAQFVQRMNPEKPPRYSRAVLETLAIIVYRQPATRGDIEQIRGVSVSPQILKTLEERGWIEAVGQREVPGRPALFATTKRFLDDLSLRSLEELPALNELQATLDMTTVDTTPARAELSPPMEQADAATERAQAEATTEETGDMAGTGIIEIEPAPPPDPAPHDAEETQSYPPAAE